MPMDFGYALTALRAGHKMARAGWQARDLAPHIELQVPDQHSKMTQPYLFMKSFHDGLAPWTPTHADLLADDWELV